MNKNKKRGLGINMKNKQVKRNKSEGVNLYSKQLDRGLKTAQERIELLNNILYTKEGYQDSFFEELCDQDARIKSSALSRKGDKQDKTKRINLFPTSKQPQSCDIYECKQIEKMADYILRAPDQPRMNKQQEYSFYDKVGFDRLIKKEKLYQGVLDNMLGEDGEDAPEGFLDMLGEVNTFPDKVHFSKERIDNLKYIDKEKKMAFLKRIGENYKCDKTQEIFKKDLKDPELKYVADLQLQIDNIKKKMKNGELKTSRWMITNILKSLKDSQIEYKECIKGTILFKSLLKDSTEIDYDEIDLFDKSHVLALINVPTQQISPENNLSLVLYDLELLISKIEIKDEDANIVKMYRSGVSQEDIAIELGISQQSVNQTLSKLANRVMQEHELAYEDWYYLNKVKGMYKKCSRCREVKLQSKFKKDTSKIDGLRYNCKKCE